MGGLQCVGGLSTIVLECEHPFETGRVAQHMALTAKQVAKQATC